MEKNSKKVKLIGGERCPACGRYYYLKLSKQQDKEYTDYCCYKGPIQNKLKSFNKFEREFVKSGYCPKCQEDIFHSKRKGLDENFFYDDELDGDMIQKFIEETEEQGLKGKDAITSSLADSLPVNEKMVYLYDWGLEDDLYVDPNTNKVLEF